MAPDSARIDVRILTPERIVLEAQADSVILPGEKGVFEVLPYHKALLTRLLGGHVQIDGRAVMKIRRGVAKVEPNRVTVVVEEAL